MAEPERTNREPAPAADNDAPQASTGATKSVETPSAPTIEGETPAAADANAAQVSEFEAKAARGEHMPRNVRPQDAALESDGDE